jgi:hypothetical protein
MIKEYCETCGKRITKKLKETQEVIYAGAEHTLSGGDLDFCDPMFGGVYCSEECYEEQSGITRVKIKTMKREVIFLKSIKENIDKRLKELLTEIKNIEKKGKLNWDKNIKHLNKLKNE